jgi:hypothetical protein
VGAEGFPRPSIHRRLGLNLDITRGPRGSCAHSVVAQCGQRIHHRRSSRGKIAGERRRHDQGQRGPRKGHRVERFDPEQQGLQLPGQSGGEGQPHHNAKADRDQGLPHREHHHVEMPCAERDSYANLTRPLADGVAQYTDRLMTPLTIL